MSLDRSSANLGFFPFEVPIGVKTLFIDLPAPGPLADLDPHEIGVVILDADGSPKSVWGLAKRLPQFQPDQTVHKSELAGLMDRGAHGGHGAIYLDGYRYFSTGAGEKGDDIFVLVVNAHEEKRARRQASKGWRVANTLKRLGKALTMNQTTQHLCVSAVHELASSTDLAAALIWVIEPGGRALRLTASVGFSRQGTSMLSQLSLQGAAGSIPELVSQSRQAYTLTTVDRNLLSANLEGRFCYLKAGGVAAYPLEIGDRLLGVLELIGKEGDPMFEEHLDLFETVSEHLALALNSTALYESAEKSALQDALTGIANHRAMQDFLHTRLEEARRSGQELGVVMIDVDHFRIFNEEHGHNAGDDVLRLVGETLRNCVRPYDLAARYGGEEFTLILPGAGRLGALSLAERCRLAIESLVYESEDGRALRVSASLGCSIFPECGRDAATLLKSADAALYEAKRQGRNRTVMYSAEMERESTPVAPEKLVQRLRSADFEAGQALLHRTEKYLNRISIGFNLSDAQRQILRGLILVTPAYTDALHRVDIEAMDALERAEEFRALLPHLHSMRERFDGSGPKKMAGDRIPLLARILQVVLAIDRGESRTSLLEEGRFDPAIIALAKPRKGKSKAA